MRDNRKMLNTYRKILGRNEKCHRTLLLGWWEYPFSQIWRDYAFTLLIIVRSLNPTILWSYGSTLVIKILWSTGAFRDSGAGAGAGAGLGNFWKKWVRVRQDSAIKKLLKIFLQYMFNILLSILLVFHII